MYGSFLDHKRPTRTPRVNWSFQGGIIFTWSSMVLVLIPNKLKISSTRLTFQTYLTCVDAEKKLYMYTFVIKDFNAKGTYEKEQLKSFRINIRNEGGEMLVQNAEINCFKITYNFIKKIKGWI